MAYTDRKKNGNKKSPQKDDLSPPESALTDNREIRTESREGREIRIVTADNSKKGPAIRILANTSNPNSLFLLPREKGQDEHE
jgi:hypothetical protein